MWDQGGTGSLSLFNIAEEDNEPVPPNQKGCWISDTQQPLLKFMNKLYFLERRNTASRIFLFKELLHFRRLQGFTQLYNGIFVFILRSNNQYIGKGRVFGFPSPVHLLPDSV